MPNEHPLTETKTGDLPAWLNIIGALVVALASGSAAWAATSAKLSETSETATVNTQQLQVMDKRLDKIEKAICAMATVQGAEVAATTPERLPLMTAALESCK